MKPDKAAIFVKNMTGPLSYAKRSVWVRQQHKNDATSLKNFFAKLSERTLYSRFMIPLPTVPPSILERLCNVDQDRHVGFVALSHPHAVIGEARYIRDANHPTSAEFSVTLAEEWRGVGLALSLMNELTHHAQEHSVDTLWADVLGDNTQMLRLARTLGFTVCRHPEDPCCRRISKCLVQTEDMKKAA